MDSRPTTSGDRISGGAAPGQPPGSRPAAAAAAPRPELSDGSTPAAGTPQRGPAQARKPAPPPPPVAKVDIYTLRFSAECMRAKALLDRKGVTYNEYILDQDDESREVMRKRSGGRDSVPQIFINGRGIDGIEPLEALNSAGQLDILLGERPRHMPAESAPAAPQERVSGLSTLLSRFRRP